VGAGVKINGYNYSYEVRNMNGDDRQPGIDTFTVSQLLRGPQNSVLLSSNQYYNTKFDWQAVSGTRTAANPYNIADTTYIQFGITGGDNGYWGGYFGPQIRNVNMSLNYSIDPCATNPAYSPTCPGFNDIITSGNLVPNPAGIATWGQLLNQTFAISTAIQHGGLGIRVHGFEWGYNTWSGNPYCANSFLGVCTDNRDPLVRTWVNIRDAAGNSLYSVTRDYNDHEQWVPRTYSYQRCRILGF
jgi:hypothetical protein